MAIEVELLGFTLTHTGAKPTAKRIAAILKLAPPKNVQGCRRIIGIINFIKNHIPMRAALMQHLTELTCKDVKLTWGKQEQLTFNNLKAAVANSVLITYPDPKYQAVYVLPMRFTEIRMRRAVIPDARRRRINRGHPFKEVDGRGTNISRGGARAGRRTQGHVVL